MNERPWTADNTPTRVDSTVANADLTVTIRRAIETLNRLVTQFNALLQSMEQYVTWPELWEWPGSENLIRAGDLVTNALEVLVGENKAHTNVGDVVIESALGGDNWIGTTSTEGSTGALFLGGSSVLDATIAMPTDTSGAMVISFANSVCFETTSGIYIGADDEAHVYLDGNGDLLVQIENDGMLYPNYIRAQGYFSADGTEGVSGTIGQDLEAEPPIDGATFKNGLYVGGEIGGGGVGGVAPPEDGVLYGVVNTVETGIYFEAIPVLEAPEDGVVYGRWVEDQEGILVGQWVLVPEEAPDDGYLWARYYDDILEIMTWDMCPPEVVDDIYVYGRGYDYELLDWVWVPVVEEVPEDIYVYGRGYDYEEEVWTWVPVTEECPDDGCIYARWYDTINDIWQWVESVEEVPVLDGMVYGRCNTSPTGGEWVLAVPDLQATDPTAVYGRAWFAENPTPTYELVVPEVANPVEGALYVRQDGDWVETFADADGEGVYGRASGEWEEVIPMADFDVRFASLAAQCELVIDVQDETETIPYARIKNAWLPIVGFPGQIDVDIDAGMVFVGLPEVNGVPTISGGLAVVSGNFTVGASYGIVLGGPVNCGLLVVSGSSQLSSVTASTGTFSGKLTANASGEGLWVSNDARVSGTATIKTLVVSGTGTIGSTLGVTGAVTLESTLNVTGTSSLATCNCSFLNSSSRAYLESLETIHHVKIGTSLVAMGNSEFHTNVQFDSTSSFYGTATFNAAVNVYASLLCTGTIIAAGLATFGDFSAGNIYCNYLDARSGAAIVRATTIQASAFSALFGSGNINLTGGSVYIAGNNLYVSGSGGSGGLIECASLNVSGNITGTWNGNAIAVNKLTPGTSGYYLKTDGSSAYWSPAASSAWPDDGTTKSLARVSAMHVGSLIFDA